MGEIRLTIFEVMQGAFSGLLRQCDNIAHSAKPAHGHDDDTNPWQIAIDGALGEMVLAKHFNIYWGGKGIKGGGDVGNLQVRTTPYANGYLRLHKKDEDGAKFYLVTGKPPKYTVRGWLLAKDGKRPEFWGSIGKGGVIDPNGTYRPAYWVPQDKLNIGD
jgi:hypothetical protein